MPAAASLLSATGDDGGLRTLPGVLQGPRFILAALAPTRPFPTLWDYFDARTVPETLGSWLALAAWAGDAPAAAGIKAALRAVAPSIPANDTETTAMNAPLALIYYTALGRPGEEAALPLARRFRGVETAAVRSSWADENATFIAFKGLNTTGNWAHTHLDQGSFVFATHGQFFAQDLGSDEYSAPGYFSGSRFDLYRTNASGHNTLSFSGRNPLCKVIATYSANCTPALFDVFNETDAAATASTTAAAATAAAAAATPFPVDVFAIVNLTEGLQVLDLGLLRVQRGFIVGAGGTQLVVVDEIAIDASPPNPSPPVWWKLHTVANVSISADLAVATLTTLNVSVAITVAFLPAISACPGAAFSVSPLNLQPPLLDSPGVSVLRLEAAAAACARIVVVVGVAPPGVGAGLRPLGEWRDQGPYDDAAGGGPAVAAPSSQPAVRPTHLAARVAQRVHAGLPPRPRIIMDAARQADVAAFAANNSEAARYWASTLAQADWVLRVPPIYPHGVNGTNDLGGARQILQRVYALALAFRLTANETFASRCAAELAVAAQWHDWDLFDGGLVTAELLHAAAVGLDWLDAFWPSSPARLAQRAALVGAMVELGLRPLFDAYETLPPFANPNTFINATNCYGLVVNGGAVIGAAALLGEPGAPLWVEASLLPWALHYLSFSYSSFGPEGDGSWFEGPNYHLYALRYMVPTAYSLQTALGDDFGLLAWPGVESTAAAFAYHATPQFSLLNWADTDEAPETIGAVLALASRFGDAGSAAAVRGAIDGIYVAPDETGNPSMNAPVGLIFFTALGGPAERAAAPLDKHFEGRDIVVFASSHLDPNATIAHFKAGTNGGNVHLHQDQGSFVLHTRGQRVIADLGRDSYALFCYFCPPIRWDYYRLNALGHNTLTLDGKTHDYPAGGAITLFGSTGNAGPPRNGADAWAVANLTALYASLGLRRWQRGVAALAGRSALLVVDELDLTGSGASNLTWAAHSNGTVDVLGGPALAVRITTAEGGVVAALGVLPSATECPGLALAAVPVDLAPPQLPTPGIVRTQLFLDLRRGSGGAAPSCTRIAVAVGVGAPADLRVNALADWAELGPLAA